MMTKDRPELAEAGIAGLKMMFPEQSVPQPIRMLQGAFAQYQANPHHPKLFLGLMRAYESLPSVATFSEEAPPSFDEIFATYKNDQDLQTLATELVSLLERILTEADDLLTAQIARELGIILEELKKRDRRSLYEFQCWIDLGLKCLVMVVESKTGIHGLSLVHEAIKIGFRTKARLFEQYGAAQKQLIEERKLTYVAKAVARLPNISSEEDAQKAIDKSNQSNNP